MVQVSASYIAHSSEESSDKQQRMKKTTTNNNTQTSATLPCTATGRSTVACMPKMADCGGLMIGVP